MLTVLFSVNAESANLLIGENEVTRVRPLWGEATLIRMILLDMQDTR